MRTAIFDLETSGFDANSSILLCATIKDYGSRKSKTIKADHYPSWKKKRSDDSGIVKDVVDELKQYDILVAHNGQAFDKAFLNAKCLEHGIDPILRMKKFVDPVQLARKHLKLGRNSLVAIIDYLNIPVKKTPIEFRYWKQAALDGDSKCLHTIAVHCEHDVNSLYLVYDKMRALIDRIDNRGSAY